MFLLLNHARFCDSVTVYLFVLNRQIVDLTVPVLMLILVFTSVFFSTAWSLINGCDDVFDDWIWTSWFIGRSRFNLSESSPLTHKNEPVRPTQGPVYESTRFLLLKPNISYCFAKYTSVLNYYTIFFQKKIYFLFVFFPLKIFLLCIICLLPWFYLFILSFIIFAYHLMHI